MLNTHCNISFLGQTRKGQVLQLEPSTLHWSVTFFHHQTNCFFPHIEKHCSLAIHKYLRIGRWQRYLPHVCLNLALLSWNTLCRELEFYYLIILQNSMLKVGGHWHPSDHNSNQLGAVHCFAKCDIKVTAI